MSDCDGYAVHAHVGLECRACGDEFSVWCRDGSPYDIEAQRSLRMADAIGYGYHDIDDWWDFCSAECAKAGPRKQEDEGGEG